MLQEQKIKLYAQYIYIEGHAETLVQELENLKNRLLVDHFEIKYTNDVCWNTLKELDKVVITPFYGKNRDIYSITIRGMNSYFSSYIQKDSLYCSYHEGIDLRHINPTFSELEPLKLKVTIGEIIVYCNDLILEIYRLNS